MALLNALDAIDIGGSILVEFNRRLEEEILKQEEMRIAVLQILDDGVEYARNLAAVDTGAMRDSIRNGGFQEIDGEAVGVIEVGDGAPHWIFIEYGTGQRGAASDQPEPGVAEGYQHGTSAGIAAQPFLRPTLWYLRQRYGG